MWTSDILQRKITEDKMTMSETRWRHWRPSWVPQTEQAFYKGKHTFNSVQKNQAGSSVSLYMYMICARSIKVKWLTGQKMNSDSLLYFTLEHDLFFFVKLVNVKKYITFLSKVRSSRHVMLSKTATPLSAQRLCGKHLVTDSTGVSKGHHCAEHWTAAWEHARAREIKRIVVPSGYGRHDKHICALDSFPESLQTPEARPLALWKVYLPGVSTFYTCTGFKKKPTYFWWKLHDT